LNSSFATLGATKFPVIVAAPPWTYSVRTPKGNKRGAIQHYPTMKLDDICALPVADVAAKDCHLFLWTTGPNLPQALRVMEAWGFRYSLVAFDWVKLNPSQRDALLFDNGSFHVGMGHTTRKNVEYCLLGRRGAPARKSKAIRALIIAARREHSRKPDEAKRRIELYADGPYLELFAREQWPGWHSWGNEISKFEAAA
jgi:N6-adenosine-specific RNA methylase IME4